MNWSADTIKRSLQIRCATGVKGYEFLRKKHFPLPSYRSICSRVSHFDMKPGIQWIVLKWLQEKASAMEPQECDCVLVLDAVEIQKSLEYDPALKQYIGFVAGEFSPKANDELASEVMCFMVKGLTTRWKQVVGKM